MNELVDKFFINHMKAVMFICDKKYFVVLHSRSSKVFKSLDLDNYMQILLTNYSCYTYIMLINGHSC